MNSKDCLPDMKRTKKPRYYPLGLDISGKECLVVGGGKVSERKVKRLLEFQAKVWIVSPSLTPLLERWVEEGRIKYCCGRFSSTLIKGQTLIFATSDDSELNQRIVRLAERRGIPANCALPGKASSFVVPSLLRRPSFTVAISTDGHAPALAKKIKDRLERIL